MWDAPHSFRRLVMMIMVTVVELEDDDNVDAANVVSFALCLELIVVCL